MKVLVLEDELLIALNTKRKLGALNVDTLGPVGNCADALSLLRTEDADGALLDVNLGEEESFAVAEALADRGVPVAFVTGYVDRVLPQRFTDAPRLRKPIQDEELRRAIAAFGTA